MQLLDSCPLPQAQFASLSILLQVTHVVNGENNHDDPSGSNATNEYPTIVNNVSSEDIESSTLSPTTLSPAQIKTNNEIKQITVQTSNGGTTKTIPLYPKGMQIYYKHSATKTKIPATILEVHYALRFKNSLEADRVTRWYA